MRILLFLCAVFAGCSDTGTTRGGLDAEGDGGTGIVADSGVSPGDAHVGVEAADAGPPPPGDTCADAVDANAVGTTKADRTLLVAGTNAGAHKDLEVCNYIGGAGELADVVYRYTAPSTGGLRVVLQAQTPTLFTIDVRTSCMDASSTQHCDDCGVNCTLDRDVTKGDTFFIVVSGIRTTRSPDGTGSFELSFLLTPDPSLGGPCSPPDPGARPCPPGSECQEKAGAPPVCGAPACGDGFLGFTPLDCDDGNATSGDGCSATCEVDAQGAGGPACDAPATLNLPHFRGVLGTSSVGYASATGDFVPGSDLGASCSTAAGPEAVYVFELATASSVEITATNSEVLSVRRAEAADCGTEELGCTSGAPTAALKLTLDRLEKGRYAVILDREEPTLAATPTYAIDVVAQSLP